MIYILRSTAKNTIFVKHSSVFGFRPVPVEGWQSIAKIVCHFTSESFSRCPVSTRPPRVQTDYRADVLGLTGYGFQG